jgi:hypothetical protein
MTGINVDPHDMASLPAGEDLSAKQYFLVTINAAGELVLAKAGEIAFCLLNNPKKGESGTIAVPLQVKVPAAEEIKPGWKLKGNATGEVVKATEEKHVIGIALSGGKPGAMISMYSIPAGATG